MRVLAKQQHKLRWEVQKKLDMKRAPVLSFKHDDNLSAMSELDRVFDELALEKEELPGVLKQ